MLDALRFLLVAEALGLAAVPLACALLGRLPGGGLAFAKPLGLLAAAYPVWLLASVGVPYGTSLALGGAGALALAGAFLLRRQGRPGRRAEDRRLWIGAEVVFVAAFVLGTALVAFNADVRGTEKPMDMAILAATDASTGFPPLDPWLSGETLNYYYLGHYLMAYVVRLSGVPPDVGYNLSLALLLALCSVAAYGLGASLTAGSGRRRPVRIGVGAAVLVCVAGNLDAARELLVDGGSLLAYDWFATARVVPDAITEFPAFSFVLGDLHAHVLAIPWTLLALAFGLQAATAGPRWPEAVGGGVVAGSLYAINSWSFPVVAGLLALAPVVWLRSPGATSRGRAAGWAAAMLAVAVVAVLPFWLSFSPSTGGAALVVDRRPLELFLRDQALIFGALGWVLLAAAGRGAAGLRRPLRTVAWAGVAALLAGALLASRDLAGVALLVALIAATLRAAWRRDGAADRFGLLLIAGGLTCVVLPEVVYVRDEFDGGVFFRMNTVFKFGYQAWILLAVMAACVLPWGRRDLPATAWRVWAPLSLLVLIATAAFPFAGSYARTGGFADGPRLGGLAWLERDAPGDVAAIAWLRRHAAHDAVVLEAVGDDYSEFGHARISTFSGRPTVLGWAGHELQWGHDPGTRRDDVRGIYQAREASAARGALRRYGVDYVVAGPLEWADYGTDGLAKFDALGRRVLEREGTTVWRIGVPPGRAR